MSGGRARKCTANARVHLFARRVYFSPDPARRQAEAACLRLPGGQTGRRLGRQAKLDAATAACLPPCLPCLAGRQAAGRVRQANLRELGYGG